MTNSNSTSQPTNRRQQLGVVIGVLVCLGLAIWYAAARVDKGWLFPIRIGSGSMAPALLGPALHTVCADCRFPFAFDFQSAAATDYVCPNCGAVGQADASSARPGQRVTVRRIARPQRFDIVAARGSESALITKRVVGLPGESIFINGGDVFVNDRVVCKTLPQICEMAIVVHNDQFRSNSNEPPSRWRADLDDSAASKWRATVDGHSWQPITDELTALTWLTYHHAAAYSPVGDREPSSRLMDNCPYNQHTSRVLNRTSDCHVSVATRVSGTGEIYFRRHGPDRDWTVEFDTAQGTATLTETSRSDGGDAKLLVTVDASPKDREVRSDLQETEYEFLFGYWDGHFHFALNGRPLLKYELAVQGELAEVNRLFGLAAKGFDELNVENLVVARDVFYTDAYGTNQPWSLGRKLGSDEYLLLGDNSPVSRDARQAVSLGIVDSGKLDGKVVLWPKVR